MKLQISISCICFLITFSALQAKNWSEYIDTHIDFQPEGEIMMSDRDCPKSEKNCKGIRKFKDGSKYEGEFVYGEPYGRGVLTLNNGSRYTGDFKDGLRHGIGTIHYPNGDEYTGEWKKGLRHGKAVYTWKDGAKYEGGYYEGAMHGQGTITLANGESYEGEWKKNFAHGQGTYSLEDGSKHFGHYKQGKRSGSGVITWATGDIFVGKWKAGKTNRTGTFQFTNGTKYVCTWKEGEMVGDATYVEEDGHEIKGNLKEIEEKAKEGDDWESISHNLAVSWYAVAVEYKGQGKLEKALNALKEAKRLVPPSSNMGRLIYEQTQFVQQRMDKKEKS